LAVASETALVFLHQFGGSLRLLFDVSVLGEYPDLHNLYLSEPTKSMDWTRLVHFSFEVLCCGSQCEVPAIAFGARIPPFDFGQLLLKFFEPFPRISWHGFRLAPPRGTRTLMRIIVDHWLQIVDVTSVIKVTRWT
jgi:hypothetical protein